MKTGNPKTRLSDAEEIQLTNELLDALDEVEATSGCLDMIPLWFLATREPRAEFLKSDGVIQNVPPHIKGWRPPKRSKYTALAAWRHAVLWQRLLDGLVQKYRNAVQDLYFTPFPENQPPYSWSRASSRAPGAGRYSSPSVLDDRARRGCAQLLEQLTARAEPPDGASLLDEARAAFIARGARKTLRDVLRIKKER